MPFKRHLKLLSFGQYYVSMGSIVRCKELFVRICCAPNAQIVRTNCAPKRIFAKPLQYHCNAYAINIHPASLLLAIISLHLRSRYNSLLKTHATHYGHNHNTLSLCAETLHLSIETRVSTTSIVQIQEIDLKPTLFHFFILYLRKSERQWAKR